VARAHGVCKGMFLRKAIELCPDLVVIPYDYEGYEEVSVIVGDILQKCTDLYGGTIEHVSCDEAYIELHLYGNRNGDRGFKKTGNNDNLNKLLLQKYRCDENRKEEDREYERAEKGENNSLSSCFHHCLSISRWQ